MENARVGMVDWAWCGGRTKVEKLSDWVVGAVCLLPL